MAAAREPLGSVFLNPIGFASSWHYVTVAGERSPGAISVDGISGFDRETGWDKKKGKGTQGATLTLTTLPPTEGSIEFQLWTSEHFVEWTAFRNLLKYNPTKKDGQAFDIYHPSLADLDVTSVVTSKISPIRHKGKGMYVVKVDFIEYLPPPPVSSVSTPASSQANNPDANPGEPPDPIADAQQKRIAALSERAAGIGGLGTTGGIRKFNQ